MPNITGAVAVGDNGGVDQGALYHKRSYYGGPSGVWGSYAAIFLDSSRANSLYKDIDVIQVPSLRVNSIVRL